jgi:hypothetical protein
MASVGDAVEGLRERNGSVERQPWLHRDDHMRLAFSLSVLVIQD